jgi:CHASE3 domain sensor protein
LFPELKDAETGQRGFLLTSHDEYLSPYREAIVSIRAIIRRLWNRTAGYPDRVDRLKSLELVEAKLAELRETLEPAQAGTVREAPAVVDTARGKR